MVGNMTDNQKAILGAILATLLAGFGSIITLGRLPGYIAAMYDGAALIREGFWLQAGDQAFEWIGIVVTMLSTLAASLALPRISTFKPAPTAPTPTEEGP
jgi:hypothetical protein